MTKHYSTRLAKWVERRESTKHEKNLVAFLAVRDDVEAALADGFAVRTIWLNMHEEGRVACKYSTFLSLVNRHFERQRVKRPRKIQPPALQVRAPVQSTQSSPASPVRKDGKFKAPDPLPGFYFDPIPRKEDLI